MLQSAYLIAKISADTAENELNFAEILPIGRRVADPSSEGRAPFHAGRAAGRRRRLRVPDASGGQAREFWLALASPNSFLPNLDSKRYFFENKKQRFRASMMRIKKKLKIFVLKVRRKLLRIWPRSSTVSFLMSGHSGS